MSVSTHVLNTTTGRPAAGIRVQLLQNGVRVGGGTTDAGGRIPALLADSEHRQSGPYTLVFQVAEYFPNGFYPEIAIQFTARDSDTHYHIPLLMSPFGYTTYRGS